MADSDIWGRIERAARDAFGSQIDQSSSRLVDSLDCAAQYLEVDERQRCLIFNRRAFLFGVLVHGMRGNTSPLPDEADIWLASWFDGQGIISGPRETALPPSDLMAIEKAFTQEYRLILSNSMRQILVDACGYAEKTIGRPMAGLRHLAAAFMLYQGDWPAELSRTPSLQQINDWCESLLKHLTKRPGLDDNIMGWVSILMPQPNPNLMTSLGLTPSSSSKSSAKPSESITPKSDRNNLPASGQITFGTSIDEPATASAIDTRILLTPVNTDRPGKFAIGDPLNIDADVNAFARLIAAHDTALPLSIGIFGDWGTGKSTFMSRLEAAIDDLVQRKHKYFVERIIHIRFNAWQFADANLWASLTAEFFEQLRIGGHAKQIGDRYDKLVERVNTHVHALSESAAAARDALAESKKTLVDAQQARDEAVKDVARTTGEELSQSTLDAAGEAFEKHRSELADLLDIASDQNDGAALDQFLDIAKDLRSIGGQLRVIWKATWQGGWRRLLAVVALILLLALIAFGVDWFWFTTDRPASLLTRYGGWTLLATLGTTIAAIAPAVKFAAGILHSTAGFADRLDKISSDRQKKVLQSEIALRAAAIEAKARQEAVDRASRALARYVGPDDKANPPRLLRYVLEDFPDTKEMEKEIGLISRARRLFESVDAIVQQERTRRANGDGAPDLDVPDRIVLYIDDLDRCTPDQVYAVLQAIHLLLAFELFVVVVGVDVRWIEEALGKQTGLPTIPEGVAEPDVVERYELARRIKTIRYLEKIFQLPFWLRPLSTDRMNGGTYGRYVRDLTATVVQTEAGLVRIAAPDELPLARRALTEEIPPAMLAAAPGWTPSMTTSPLIQQAALQAKEAATAAEQFNPMQISDAEISFLASPSIGRLAAKDPRAVKRLVNVYRIIRASMTPAQRAALAGEMSEPATYPIAIFLIAIDIGQPPNMADTLYTEFKNWDPAALLDLQSILKESHGEREHLKPLPLAFREHKEEGKAWTEAWTKVEAVRGGIKVPIATCLDLARMIRRYSFNKY